MVSEEILRSLKEGIVIFDEEMEILYANDSIANYLGINIKGKKLQELLEPFDKEQLQNPYKEIIMTLKLKDSVKVKGYFMTTKEAERHLNILVIQKYMREETKTCMYKALEKLPYAIWIEKYQDKYENKRLYNLLNEELEKRIVVEEDLRNYLSLAVDLLVVTDEEGKILKIGHGSQNILGWSEEEIINKKLTDYAINEDERIKKIYARLKRTGKASKGVQRCITKYNQERWLEWRGKYLPQRKAYFIVLRDVTSDRRKEEEWALYKEALQMETLKSEFIANVSHELKTPLNIIYGMLQLTELEVQGIRNKSTGEIDTLKLEKYMMILKQNVYRLLRLINNIIDVTKIDAGSYKLTLVNCNVVDIIEGITMEAASCVKKKKLEIVFDTEIEELVMACDIDKLERLFLNLLSNAVKYTPKGGRILVNLKVQDCHLIIEVKDTGIGIPKNKQNIIFDRFTQVDQLFTRKCEGSGIGLALVKSFTEMFHGKVTVQSKVGEGSTFTVVLPIIRNAKESVTVHEDENERALKCHVEFSDIYNI